MKRSPIHNRIVPLAVALPLVLVCLSSCLSAPGIGPAASTDEAVPGPDDIVVAPAVSRETLEHAEMSEQAVEASLPALPAPLARPVPPGQLLVPSPLLRDCLVSPAVPSVTTLETAEGLPLPRYPVEASAEVTESGGLDRASLDRGDVRDDGSGVGLASVAPVRVREGADTTTGPREPVVIVTAQPQTDTVPSTMEYAAGTGLTEGARPSTTGQQATFQISTPVTDEGTGPSAVSSGESVNRRTASVAAVDELRIVLPGTGWLYVGREYGDGTVEFVDKRGVSSGEEFRFRLSAPGEYGLWFQQQDIVHGQVTNEHLALTAASVEPSATLAVADLPLTGAAERLPGSEVVAAGGSFEAGETSVQNPTEADEPEVADPADGSSGEQVVGRAFWAQVASSGSAEAPAARRELFRLSLDGTPEEVLEAFSLLSTSDEASESDYRDTIDALLAAARYDAGADLVDQYLSGIPGSAPGADELLYRIAGFLEQPGPYRDLQRSLRYYRRLMDEFPVSRYWEPSRTREEFLNRHYFEVR
jgi:hypothetical protein